MGIARRRDARPDVQELPYPGLSGHVTDHPPEERPGANSKLSSMDLPSGDAVVRYATGYPRSVPDALPSKYLGNLYYEIHM